ncbi:hypothetical protein P5719_010005, partial [Lactobacillus amylovorus]
MLSFKNCIKFDLDIKEKEPNCSDPRNSDMNLEGFTMSKLTKKDKIHIFEEWTLENKRGTYLS